MEQTISGNVILHKISGSRALRRFVEKCVARWIESVETLRGVSPRHTPHYQVVLRREGEGHLVDCRVEVRYGQWTWRGFDYGLGPQQAIRRCLSAMSAA